MLRFAANLSMLFTHLPLTERFAAARAAGFEAVEIQFPYDTPLAELQQAQRQAGVKVVLINVPAGDLMTGGDGLAGVPGREAEFRKAVEAAIPYATGLEVDCVNVLSGRLADGVERETALATLGRNLTFAAARFAEIGVKVTSEAINFIDIPRFLLNTTDDMNVITEQVSHPNFYLQVDLYHLARMGEDLEKVLRDNIGRIAHIQFADLPGRGAPGSGTLDFPHLFGLIDTLPYAGWTAAEYKSDSQTIDNFGWRVIKKQAG